MADPIRTVTPEQIRKTRYGQCFSGCLILTHDGQILLQQRPENWRSFGGALATFGGRIERNETPIEALKRELSEELEASIDDDDVTFLGAITEAATNHRDLVYAYIWRDRSHTIGTCHEGTPVYYATANDALAHPHIMDDVRWIIDQCRMRGFLPEE